MYKLLAVFAFVVFSLPAHAQTPAQRQACEQDAYRLCQDAIPDESKVRRCLASKVRRLSPTCRTAFQGGKARKARKKKRR
jgi:hypothetical protein